MQIEKQKCTTERNLRKGQWEAIVDKQNLGISR